MECSSSFRHTALKCLCRNKGLQCDFGYITFDGVVKKGVSFLFNKIGGLSSPYSQAMVAYALALAGDDTADQLVDKLFLSADRTGCCFSP